VEVPFDAAVDVGAASVSVGQASFAEAFSKLGANGLSAEVQEAAESANDIGTVLTITLVNTSDAEAAVPYDPRFYEAKFSITGIDTTPFFDQLRNNYVVSRRKSSTMSLRVQLNGNDRKQCSNKHLT